MKKHLLLLIPLIIASVSSIHAQIKVEKYCQVIVSPKGGFTNKRIAKISFGEDKSLFALKDTSEFEQLKYVNSLTTETDVLNYMSKIKWRLVNVHSFGLYTNAEVFYFVKGFGKSELTDTSSE